MDSTNKTTSNFCSNCGNKLNEGMLFCDKCGMKVGTDKSDLVSSSVNEKSKNGTKKSKPAKRIVLVVVIILAGMCAMLIKGNSKKYITQVKKSHYSKYNSVTYEMAFKLYGKGEKWSYFKSDKHENIVEYETKAEYQGKDAKIVLQFMCQGNKVECVYFGHDGKDGTKNDINLYLESVFASYITKGAKRDLTSLINKNIDRVGMDYCLVSDETFDEDDGIKMLKNGCWNITDADGDGSIDMIAVSAENKYNILGLQYGENYSDISKKISSDYKVSEIEDGGNGITYAKSDDYYLRIKYQNSEITEIVFTKNDPEIIGEESEGDGSLGETSGVILIRMLVVTTPAIMMRMIQIRATLKLRQMIHRIYRQNWNMMSMMIIFLIQVIRDMSKNPKYPKCQKRNSDLQEMKYLQDMATYLIQQT